jgi:lactate dehydrogenase-like 2-hydroxyacid dehydrogenase
MTKPRIFVSRVIPDKGLIRLREIAEVDLWEEEVEPPYEVLTERVRGVDGLVCLLTDRIDGALMDAAGPGLRVISQMAVGYDNIDITAATERGIPVGHTPGVLTDTTADFAFALLMAGARRIVEGDAYVKTGRWKTWGPTLLMGHDITGATLGIVGFGRIGQGMAKRAAGFAMRVLVYDPHPDRAVIEKLGAAQVDMDILLTESDFVSLHVPLTAETRGLMNSAAFKRMKPSAVLINTARGPVVDQDALYDALTGGVISYAALDVTDPEPLPATHKLVGLSNCLIVPHIASSSLATRSRMADMVAANLEAGLKREALPYCVNPQAMGRAGT